MNSGGNTVALRLSVLLAALASAGCGLDKTGGPALTGPSGFAQAIELTASPDRLPRDGVSVSVVTVTVRDVQGSPAGGQRLSLATTAGTLAASEVTTLSNGTATVLFTAPPVANAVPSATVSAIPVGDNAANAVPRNVTIELSGPSAPTAAFTFSPESPARFQSVTFNASASTLEGEACGSRCTYSWNFGGEATKTGQVVNHQFQQEQSYLVTLTVTTESGTIATSVKTVTVGTAAAPTAAFSISPTNPAVGMTVFFNAAASSAANGATIVRYHWNFGNGTTVTTTDPTASTTYGTARTYTVQLIVEDSNGRTDVQEATLTIAAS